MRLTVVGCAGTFPGPTSPCSSYLYEAEGFRLLVDVGNGATGSLQSCCGLLELDAVVVTHLHGDHYLDLVNYTYVRRYHPEGAAPPLPVYGPPGIRAHLSSAFGPAFAAGLVDDVYRFTELAPGRRDIGPFQVEFRPMNHPVATFAMRISAGGGVVAYSADTGACAELVAVARGADMFLCEASYLDGQDNPPNVHLTGREAGQHAARAEVGRLVLTHLVPWGDRARTLHEGYDAFSGDVTLATTHAVFEL